MEKSSLKLLPCFISLAAGRGRHLGSGVFKLQEIRMWVWAKTLLVAAWWGDLFVEWDQQPCWKLGDLSLRHCAIMVDMCKKMNGKPRLTEWSVKEGTQRPCPSGLTFRLKAGTLQVYLAICLRECSLVTRKWDFSLIWTLQCEMLTKTPSLGFKNVFNTGSLENI